MEKTTALRGKIQGKSLKRNMRNKLQDWFQNLSLNSKIILLVCLAGFLPMGITLFLSIIGLSGNVRSQQMYALNQGYEQVGQALSDKMLRVHNISTLLTVNDMVNLTLRLGEEETSIAEQLASFENINSYSYSIEMAFDTSKILFYVPGSLPVVTTHAGRYHSLAAVSGLDWYECLMNNNGKPTWVVFSENEHDKSGRYVAITRQLWDRDDYSQSTGMLAVLVERQYLVELLIGSMEGQILYLENTDGMLLASSEEGDFARVPVADRGVNDRDYRDIYIGDTEYLVRTKLITGTNTYLVSILPKSVIEKELVTVSLRTVIIYLVVCILTLITFIPLTRSVTGRIGLVKEQMILIKQGIIRKIDVGNAYNDEIGQLIIQYNDMTDKVEELLKEQYALGQEKTGAELKALQSQINPHFLYNTLDMIGWMAQKNETENIREVVLAMSRFYRLALSNGRDIVTIEDELRMCEAYMEIQGRRYKGRIQYVVEVEDILPYLIPKITLQPFLENAIVHGINEKENGRGQITLSGFMEDGRITLSVMDDGVGMDANRKKNSPGSHYGMENIEKRLQLFYGEEVLVQIESSPGLGTCIIINIPAKTKIE